MPNIDDILVNNLRDALQQAQRYIISGITSAALFLLLTSQAPELLRSKQPFDLPTLGEVAPGPAAIILMLAYLAFGLLANSVIGRIRTIEAEINDVRIVKAALTQFSVVTIENRVIRWGAVLLPPLLLLVGYLIEHSRSETPVNVFTIVGFAVIAGPYLVLAYRLRKPIKGA